MLHKIQKLFNKGCTDYHLLEDGDRILVALSGGKDSLMLVKLIALRSRIYCPKISVEAAHVVMDNIPYKSDINYLTDFCSGLDVKLNIIHSSFDETTDKRKSHCFLCAWNRRKSLFNFAKDNGFNKIALGHHLDDILTTFLMNITFEGNASTMRPLMKLEHYPIEVIRPLCLVRENLIREYAKEVQFRKQISSCPYETESKRAVMNRLLSDLETINPEAYASLWHAAMKDHHDNNTL